MSWAAEIVVIDSFSTDRTLEIASAHGARVVQLEFRKFGELRQAGIANTAEPWVFSLDSDERCSPEARDEILRIVADPASADAYLVPRRNILLGRSIRHSGWYPDYRQPQLFRRGRMTYAADDDVHEGWTLEGRLGRMRAPITQIPYRTLAEAIGKMNRYTSLGVPKQVRAGAASGFAKAASSAAAGGPSPRPTSFSSVSSTADRASLSPSFASRTHSTSTRSWSSTGSRSPLQAGR